MISRLILWLCVGALTLMLTACERNQTVQRGYRGLAMLQVYSPASLAKSQEINVIPEPEDRDPPDPSAPTNKESFKNVQVLTDLSVLDFTRLMQAMSTWVAPDEGCVYCHNTKNLASDEKYTKVVARRMLQMTRDINSQWSTHVAQTGVTCWTCHRGQAVPSGDWFTMPHQHTNMLGDRAGQNVAGIGTNANTSLPTDPLQPFLNEQLGIRVQGTQALAGENRHSIKQTEWTYSLMLYMSKSLGVNCTYCHNTRAMGNWTESTPQRVTAWHGIRMVRAINNDYLNPLKDKFPPHRLSDDGDGPKVGCATCHKGTYKPLFGTSMLGDYPELAGPVNYPLKPHSPPAAKGP